LNVHYCVLFSSRVRITIRVRIRFQCLVGILLCTRRLFVLLPVVIVTLPSFTN